MEKTFLTINNEITRHEQEILDETSNFANVGTILDGKYEIKREIARGGMGIVYESYHQYTHKRVAIKVILADKVAPIQLKRFQKEIEAYSLLSHPNVITIYDAGVYNNYPYIAMEYIEGVDICTYVKQYEKKNTPADSKNESGEPRDWRLCARLIYEVALGLEYIHSQKMIHRDIKPSNIMVRPNGSPVIIDLGLVKFTKQQSYTLTRSKELLGTIEYMPIEQAKGKEDRLDARTDVYSLGLVLYELLTEQRAYDGENIMELLYKLMSYYPPLPREINPQIPEVLEEITIHATEKQKGNRYASMKEFSNALKEYLNGTTTKPTPQYAQIKKRLWLGRNKNKVIASCIAVLLVIVLVIIVIFSGNQSLEETFQSALKCLDQQNVEEAHSIFEELSNQGYAPAQYQLGLMSEQKKDYIKACEWLEKSANLGHAKAQDKLGNIYYQLGLMYYEGQEVEQDFAKACEWLEKSANLGHAEAQDKLGNIYYKLGLMYYNGDGLEQNFEKAVEWLEKSANLGYAEAQYRLGIMYYKGDRVEKNFAKALEWLEKSANKGDAKAQCKLGDMYANGDSVEQDDEKAVYWYEKATEQGNEEAQCKLEAIYYRLGNMFYSQKNYKKAFELFKKSAEKGNAEAQYQLGLMYYKGEGVKKDNIEASFWLEAVDWLEKSAKQGNIEAQYQLGLMYLEVENYEEAVYWLEKLAEKGHKEAQYYLALMYYEGQGGQQDYKKAFELFKRSAEKGHKEAQYYLALMYYNGDGVDKDAREAFEWFKRSAMQENAQAQYQLGLIYYKDKANAIEAFEWFEKSAMQENADAQYQLGLMYYNGDRVDKDAIKAFEWFKKSAMQENAEAQYQLGLMYYNGDGVKKDAIEAFEWFKKSAEQGNAEAQLKLGDMYANGESYDRNSYYQGVRYAPALRVNRSDDYKEAIKWYTKSAEQGNVDAQIRLADLLMKIKNYEKQRENYEKQFRRNSNAGSKKINTPKNNTRG